MGKFLNNIMYIYRITEKLITKQNKTNDLEKDQKNSVY